MQYTPVPSVPNRYVCIVSPVVVTCVCVVVEQYNTQVGLFELLIIINLVEIIVVSIKWTQLSLCVL